MSVCGNATSKPNAIVNVTTDAFANNSPMNELTLPNFYDGSKKKNYTSYAILMNITGSKMSS